MAPQTVRITSILNIWLTIAVKVDDSYECCSYKIIFPTMEKATEVEALTTMKPPRAEGDLSDQTERIHTIMSKWQILFRLLPSLMRFLIEKHL